MTAIDHETSAAVEMAAIWYSENRERCPRPIVPFLRERFGLTAVEVCQALTEAQSRMQESARG